MTRTAILPLKPAKGWARAAAPAAPHERTKAQYRMRRSGRVRAGLAWMRLPGGRSPRRLSLLRRREREARLAELTGRRGSRERLINALR